ncbi:MAG: hypothetical protein ACK559_34725, partial [bacterium]
LYLHIIIDDRISLLQCLSSWSESTLLYIYTPVYRLYATPCRRGRRFLTAASAGSTLPCFPFHWKRYLKKNFWTLRIFPEKSKKVGKKVLKVFSLSRTVKYSYE